MYLLDTNVVSELRKPRPHGAVLAWLESVPDEELFVSAVTLGELQAGVEITREQDPEKASEIEAWIDRVEETWNVLPLDGRVLRLWGKLTHRRSDDLLVDALIAATALVHRHVIVTRNTRDFVPLGVEVFDPFTAGGADPGVEHRLRNEEPGENGSDETDLSDPRPSDQRRAVSDGDPAGHPSTRPRPGPDRD